MKWHELSRLLPVALATLAMALPSFAQERIAQLTSIDGPVNVTRARDGSEVEARKIGQRIRNGSIFGGDVVTTGASAEAVLGFSDGSTVKLGEGTSLSVAEVDLSTLRDSGRREKPIGRRIKVLAGDIWTHIAPNPQIATEFETPSGVAAVKGTILRLSVNDCAANFATDEGLVEIDHLGTGLGFDLAIDQALRLACLGNGLQVDTGGSKGRLPIRLGDTERLIQADPDTSLDLRFDGYSADIEVRDGSVFESGRRLNRGRRLGYAWGYYPAGEGAPTRLKTTDGLVQLTNLQHGIVTEVDNGMGLSIESLASGDLRLRADADNPRPLTVSYRNERRELQPGSEVEGDTRSGSFEFDVLTGSVEIKDPSGSQEVVEQGEESTVEDPPTEEELDSDAEDTDPLTEEAQTGASDPDASRASEPDGEDDPKTEAPADCGECGIAAGGSCSYTDSLCPDTACFTDRRCSQGTCTQGRPKTSEESSTCQ